jgi:hypothetical protein
VTGLGTGTAGPGLVFFDRAFHRFPTGHAADGHRADGPAANSHGPAGHAIDGPGAGGNGTHTPR